jgi:hypothetical protein
VLTHENSRVCIVQQIAGEIWQLRNDLSGDFGVSLCRDEYGEAWRGEKRQDKLPRRQCALRPPHDPNRKVSPKWCTMHPVAPVGAQANRDRAHEIASRRRRRKSAHWCRRRALTTLHGVVQRVAIGNINECAAAAELWQDRDSLTFSLRAKQHAQRGLDQFGHGAALTCGLPLELSHDGIVDVERGFHMETHITEMDIWLPADFRSWQSRRWEASRGWRAGDADRLPSWLLRLFRTPLEPPSMVAERDELRAIGCNPNGRETAEFPVGRRQLRLEISARLLCVQELSRVNHIAPDR